MGRGTSEIRNDDAFTALKGLWTNGNRKMPSFNTERNMSGSRTMAYARFETPAQAKTVLASDGTDQQNLGSRLSVELVAAVTVLIHAKVYKIFESEIEGLRVPEQGFRSHQRALRQQWRERSRDQNIWTKACRRRHHQSKIFLLVGGTHHPQWQRAGLAA
jgi:hypothetical protein